MKFKTLFKCLSGLAISSSLIPVGMSFNNKALSLSLDNQNVGNLDSSNEVTWDIDDSGYISPHDKSQVGESINIPSSVDNKTVTGIADNAFNGCGSLKSVTFKNGFSGTTIKYRAFNKCDSLETINFPSSITTIEDESFYWCLKLKNINLPSNLVSIGARVFSYSPINFLNIPRSVKTIGDFTFSNIGNSPQVFFNWDANDLSQLSIGNGLFYRLNTTTIKFFVPLEMIDSYTNIFTQNKLGSNVVSNWNENIWKIDDNGEISPKQGATIPAELHIPKAWVNSAGVKTLVKKIEDSAFENDSTITSLVFDDLDENQNIEIGRDAFTNCSKLANVNISKGVSVIGFRAFFGCNSLTSANIQNGVTSIGNGAFYNCGALTSINIPNSVTSIGDTAFKNCSSLTTINIPNSVNNIAFGTFWDCTSLTNINIPDKVTEIHDHAFENTALTAISIPNKVTTIWWDAFAGCGSLTSITIPNSVTKIYSGAFKLNSTNNVNVQIHQDIDHADKQSSDSLIAQYKEKLTAAGLTNPTTYTTWFDSNTISPSETISFFNLDSIQVITNINNGFKTWKDEKPSNRSITLKYTTSDNNINVTGTLDDNLSTITTTITGNIPNIEAKDVTFTPQLRLRDDSSNILDKVINLQSGTIHLSENNNSNETHQFNKNTVINNNRDGLWIPGDIFQTNLTINKAYFGTHYNDKEYIKTHFDEFINVEGKSTYTFNHNQGTNIYTHPQIGQLEVANIEESNHDWQITLKFTLPESDQYKLLTQSINFIPKLDPTKGTMFSLLTKSIDEYDPNWNGLEPENLTLPFNEQNGTVIWNDTDQNKVKILGNTNTCKWAVSKGYRLEISDFTNEFISLDQQATFDVNTNQLEVNFKKLKQIVENQNVNLSGLKLLIKDGNNVIKKITLPDLVLTLSVQHFNWVPLLTSIFSTILVVGLCATFGVYLKEKRTKEIK